MRISLRLAVLVLLVGPGMLTAAKKKKAQEKSASAEAARVAILLYNDKTGTQNFEYMPGSLKEAITSSMHEKFEFNEVDSAKVEPVASKVRTANKGKLGAKEAAEICRTADIDILIYGDFTFNQAANEIQIHTNISLGSTDKYRVLPPVENRVDSTIFQAADKVATDIVAEITKVALEQQQARGNGDAAEKGGKTQLAKTEKSKTWADINWNFSLMPGAMYPLVSRDNATVEPQPVAAGAIMYRLKNQWHVGVYGSYTNLRSSSKTGPYETNMDHIAGTATLGYYFDLSARWRLTTMVGAGYYYGRLSVYSNCNSGSSCGGTGFQSISQDVKNPFAMARSGMHFLVFSFLSLGVEAEYRFYYDSKPVNAVAANLVLSAVF